MNLDEFCEKLRENRDQADAALDVVTAIRVALEACRATVRLNDTQRTEHGLRITFDIGIKGASEASDPDPAETEALRSGPYTEAEDRTFREMAAQGAKARTIARELCRDPRGVGVRLTQFRKKAATRQPAPAPGPAQADMSEAVEIPFAPEFSAAEDLVMGKRFLVGASLAAVSREIKRPQTSIKARWAAISAPVRDEEGHMVVGGEARLIAALRARADQEAARDVPET